MKLVDLHHEPGETDFPSVAYTPSEYPCGCRLHLNEQQLEKLGIKQPEAGTTLRIEAVAVVTRSTTEDPDADGDIDSICVELQMVKLGVEEGRKHEDGDEEEDEEEEENAVNRRAGKARKLWNFDKGKKDAKASK